MSLLTGSNTPLTFGEIGNTFQSQGYDFTKNNTIVNPVTGTTSPLNTGSNVDWMTGLQTASMGMSALTGIGNLYNSYKSRKLAEKQFNFQKSLAEANYANQAKVLNNTYDSAANISAQLGGTTPGSSLTNSKVINDYKTNSKNTQHVASTLS